MTSANKDISWPGFKTSSWGERHTVVAFSFLVAALNYALRFNLSIGIVAMVNDHPPALTEGSALSSSSQPSYHPSEMCPSLESDLSTVQISNLTLPMDALSEILQVPADSKKEYKNNGPTFPWDERDQGLVLGSFFWGYVFSQIPGGLLAQKYGGKWIIAWSMLVTGVLSMFLPHAAILGGRDYVIVIRILQGLAEGVFVPSLINLQAKWIAPGERARLSAMCFAGFPFGTSVTLLISGYLIPEYGWPSVFYFPGVLAIILFLFWIWKIHSSPESHPSITAEELIYIKDSIKSKSNCEDGESGNKVKQNESDGDDAASSNRVPWADIICSFPVWAIFTSQFCSAWGHNMLKSEGPKYLDSALHFDIHQNSYVAASPYLAQVIFTLVIGRLSDILMERKLISMLTVRKLCNSIGQWGIAFAFVGIIVSGCSRTPAVICFILSGMVNGAMNCGAYINIVDISPNYAGAIEGVINSVANVAGFGAPYLAGLILYHEPSILGWRYVFAVPVVINLIGNLVFLLGTEVKVQGWNHKRSSTSKELEAK